MTDRRVHCPLQGCTTGTEAEMDAHVLTPHPAGTSAAGPYGLTIPLGLCHNPEHAHLTREDAAQCVEDRHQDALDDMRH